MFFSRILHPSTIRLSGRALKIRPLTTIPLHERTFKRERSFSTTPTPKAEPGSKIISQIVREHAAEQDPVKKEKAIAEGLLEHYFTRKGRFRVVVDDEPQPKITYRNSEGTEVDIPSSHIALYRIERPDTVNADGKGKIHALLLYVHGEMSQTLYTRLMDILGEKDEAGELDTPRFAIAMLQMGIELSFFKYDKRK